MDETRKMFLTQQRLERRMRELENFRFIDLTTISPMTAMPGGLGVDEVYHGMPEKVEGMTFALGDEFIGRDRYLWAQKTVTLPAHREGCEAYGVFDFGKTGGGHNSGFESLLYVDGHPYQGVDTYHNDVNFESLAGKTVQLTFMLWTGLEGGGPRREFRHLFRQADLGYLHKATDELYYLAKAIVKETALLDDNSTDKIALTRAIEHAFMIIDWDVDHFYDTVDDALATLKAELAELKNTSEITVNVVGHTHIDVAWLWRLKHTREKAQRSFATVLRLMNEFDEYIFLQSQPQLYQYIKKDCPEIYEQMKARIAEGRWEADGGMWLEADCNISSGEALTRQFLYGMRFLMKEFGHRCEYLWLPDVFGYSWALPQILKGVGINTFMTTKISWNQFNNMPHDLFKWRGIDGSEVMTYFVSTPGEGQSFDARSVTYNGMISPRSVLGSWNKFHDKHLSNETLISYGFGDGGGGVNRNMLKMRRAMDGLPGLPAVKQSRAGDVFRRLHERIENTDQYVSTWDGELYLEFHRGTYTSQAWNKMMNRRMEFALAETEWLSAQALLAGGKYDQDALVEDWQTVLRNQFHDIIPGSSIHEVYEDCHKEYGQVEASVEKLQREALETLARPEKDCTTVWNFGSFARTDEVFIAEAREGAFVDAEGGTLRAQRAENGYIVEVTLPALAAATVRFVEAKAEEAAAPFKVDTAARTLETPHYIVAWNGQGNITRLFDRDNEREVLPAGERANVLEVYEDKPIYYDNWDVDLFHMLKHEEAAADGAPELIAEGALRLTLRFHYTYRHSTFEQDVIFHADSRRIDFETRADWHENHRLLKAAFPLDIRTTKATYDIQYGHVERPTHFNTSWDYARFEVVAHKWADMSEEGYGVSVLNNCKYGYSAHDNVLRITLLKSGKYPDTEADMGRHEFTYALLPHAGSVVEGDTIEESVKLNLPLHKAEGMLWAAAPLVETGSRSVIVDAVKKAEDDDCLVVRIHECRGSHTRVTLRTGAAMKAFAPCNLLEEPAAEPQQATEITTALRPFEIQTFKIWVR